MEYPIPGALLEKFFEGLKTPEPEDEEWF